MIVISMIVITMCLGVMNVKLGTGFYRYDGKLVISGRFLEMYTYSKGVYKVYGKNKNGRAGKGVVIDEEQKEKNRNTAIMRARRTIKRIVNANIGQWGDDVTCKFLTLTFAGNVNNVDVANYEFKKFIKRLNYEIYGTKCSYLKYTAVIEFQKRGAVHYHVIFYNLPYVAAGVIEKVWKNGYVKVNKIDDIDNVGSYICKYMTKDNDDERLRARKSYFNSRGLKKPIEKYCDKDEMQRIKETVPGLRLICKSEFENEYMGNVVYEQYNILQGEGVM